MKLRTIRKNTNLKNKRILVRIDANVPIKKQRVVDGKHGKIARAAVDIDWLSQRGARVVLMTHVGRPGGKKISAYSAKPAAKRLSELLGTKINVSKDVVGENAERTVENMEPGQIIMLENVRFDAREERNAPSFAQALAKLGDIYVNDAFSVCHRAHASVDAIADEIPSYAGPLLAREVEVLQKIVKNPKLPFYVVMGGLKVKSKLPVMKRLLPIAEKVIVGGALATAFFRALGHEVGESVYDKEGVSKAKKLLRDWGDKIVLPEEVKVASSFQNNAKLEERSITGLKPKDKIVDIGDRSIQKFINELSEAKTIVWNGPFGYCERPKFCVGTTDLARGIAARTGKAMTVIGGGDTVPYVEAIGLADKFSLVSTGGGAMLAFLAGDELPGLEALKI